MFMSHHKKIPFRIQKQWQELNCGNYQPCRIFLRKQLALKVIQNHTILKEI